ncbi:MAG: hypothetical protein EBU11_11660, partial [Gammaproteobacteria bacterium]|nr:hypothetical protein [Gammaproteobacteria bacterium]
WFLISFGTPISTENFSWKNGLTRTPLRRIQASSINGYFPYFLSFFLIKIFSAVYFLEFS